ncbi:MAG: hypothetical protein IKN24_08855 [Lachnospiraceae bacterium]|nr:hypothetical protein [Lachnospiraceae bacterium]
MDREFSLGREKKSAAQMISTVFAVISIGLCVLTIFTYESWRFMFAACFLFAAVSRIIEGMSRLVRDDRNRKDYPGAIAMFAAAAVLALIGIVALLAAI